MHIYVADAETFLDRGVKENGSIYHGLLRWVVLF
jgi:hypothetical protein